MKNKSNNIRILNINGNVTIMVLIIGLVIIVAITTLTQYMFRDIAFTKLDESKLKALNIAESGVANMFSRIEKFYSDESEVLPSSPYSGEVVDSENNVQGSYAVAYEEIFNDEDKLTNYIITSEGTDEYSGQTRTVRVNLAVSFSTEVDIFGYIYSRESLEFFDLINVPFINGPLYVGEDFAIRDLIQLGDVVDSDKILVGGNIDLEGYINIGGPTRIRSVFINVGGNIEMSGALIGSTLIESSSPTVTLTMIVMGDIRMSGNSRIGSSSNPIDLSCHGSIVTGTGSSIYYNQPMGDDLFDPPKLNVGVYVNGFINQIKEPPSDVLEIDPVDMIDDVFIIDPELIPDLLPPNDVFLKADGDNVIRFYEDGGSYFLEVEGNVLVEGDIKIGEDIENGNLDLPDNDIYYSGTGKLIATGNIDASCGLVPTDTGDFPESSMLILMSAGDLNISVDDYNNNPGDYEDPDVYILGISGGTAVLSSYNAVLGSLIANEINAKDADDFWGLLGSRATIGYESDLNDNIPEDLPKLVYGGVTFSEQWEEVIE